jgi:hypothetical protein
VIEIPERRSALVIVTENLRRKIRSFQVPGPLGVETVHSRVDGLQPSDVLVRQLIPYSDDGIDIAIGIKVTNREGALEVGSYK